MSRYPTLHAVLGTRYGGDGKERFALPDLRGQAPATEAQPVQYIIALQGAFPMPV